MHGRFTQRFSYGNVMSTVALFVALGGVSYAGTSLPANSVGKSASHSPAAQPGPRGPRGPRGFRGPKGPAGPQGQQGPKGDSGTNGTNGKNGTNGTNGTNGATQVVVRSVFFSAAIGQVNCNAGERATGGGVTGDLTGYYVNTNEPTPNSGTPTGWKGGTRLISNGQAGNGTVYVVCASP